MNHSQKVGNVCSPTGLGRQMLLWLILNPLGGCAAQSLVIQVDKSKSKTKRTRLATLLESLEQQSDHLQLFVHTAAETARYDKSSKQELPKIDFIQIHKEFKYPSYSLLKAPLTLAVLLVLYFLLFIVLQRRCVQICSVQMHHPPKHQMNPKPRSSLPGRNNAPLLGTVYLGTVSQEGLWKVTSDYDVTCSGALG